MSQSPPQPPDRSLWDLVRHTLVYGSGFVTMAAASLVLVPLYTHRLSPASYGVLGLMLAFYGLMKQVYDLGFMNAVGRFYFDGDGDGEHRVAALDRLRATGLSFLTGYGAVLTLILWVFAGEWSQLLTQSSAHGDLVRIVAVTLYAECLTIVPLTLIRMQERSKLFVAISLIRFVATLGLSILFVVVLDWGVRGALLANAASVIGVLVPLLPGYRVVARMRPSRTVLREMLGFGLPFFPVLLSNWFIEASDRYLIGLYRGTTEVGWYVLSYKVAQGVSLVVGAFSLGWAPLRYRIASQSDAPAVYRRLTNAYVIAAGVLTVAVAVFSREIVAIVAPPSYAPAAGIVPLIVFSCALSGLYLMMVTGMGVTKKTKPMVWIVGVAAAANIGLNIPLIPRFGMQAAAATTVLSSLIMTAGAWYYSQRVYPIPYDLRRLGRVTAAAAAVIAATVLLTPGTGVAGIACATGAVAFFIVLLVLTGAIGPAERAAVRASLGRARTYLRPRAARRGLADDRA